MGPQRVRERRSYGLPFEPECPETKRLAEDNKDYCTDGSGDYVEETHQHFVLVIGADGKGETALR